VFLRGAVFFCGFFEEPPPVSFGWLGRQPHPLVAPLPFRSLKPPRLARLTALSRAALRRFAPLWACCAREGEGGPAPLHLERQRKEVL